MSYGYFAGRGRRGRDLGRKAITAMNRETLKRQICAVEVDGYRCGCPAVAAILNGGHVCSEHLQEVLTGKIEVEVL